MLHMEKGFTLWNCKCQETEGPSNYEGTHQRHLPSSRFQRPHAEEVDRNLREAEYKLIEKNIKAELPDIQREAVVR